MIAAALALLAAASAPGCAAHWRVELDTQSFAHNGAGKTFAPARLARFRSSIETALKSAAAGACRDKTIALAKAAAVRRVRVLSASGASEPTFYAHGQGTLNFEWVFAEEDLAVPPKGDIAVGLTCWAKPADPICADQGD